MATNGSAKKGLALCSFFSKIQKAAWFEAVSREQEQSDCLATTSPKKTFGLAATGELVYRTNLTIRECDALSCDM